MTAWKRAGRESSLSRSPSPYLPASTPWFTRVFRSLKRWPSPNPSALWRRNRRNAPRDRLVKEGMRRILAVLRLFSVSAIAANVRLYRKVGAYQIVREYSVQEDRVHYYSIERSDWEDIPLALVDLKRAEREIAERKAATAEETKM